MNYVTYCRVSTDKQGVLGLGMEAQRDACAQHAMRTSGSIIAAYIEAESGKNHVNRPQLLAAIEHCKRTGSTLLIAKLDRLARNVAFVSSLMESGVEFVAADNPTANRLTIHIMAAFAEHERATGSKRTKEALGSIKKRIAVEGQYTTKSGKAITHLGGFRGVGKLSEEQRINSLRTRRTQAAQRNQHILHHIKLARSMPRMTLQMIANFLNTNGIATPRGNGKWTATQVKRIEDGSK